MTKYFLIQHIKYQNEYSVGTEDNYGPDFGTDWTVVYELNTLTEARQELQNLRLIREISDS